MNRRKYPRIAVQLPPLTQLMRMAKGQKKPQGKLVIAKPCAYCKELTYDRYEVQWGWSRSDDTNEHICPRCKEKEFTGA